MVKWVTLSRKKTTVLISHVTSQEVGEINNIVISTDGLFFSWKQVVSESNCLSKCYINIFVGIKPVKSLEFTFCYFYQKITDTAI